MFPGSNSQQPMSLLTGRLGSVSSANIEVDADFTANRHEGALRVFGSHLCHPSKQCESCSVTVTFPVQTGR